MLNPAENSTLPASETSSFDAVLRELLPAMRAYAISMLRGKPHAVEEVVQESLLHVWRRREELPGIRNLRAWVLRVVYFKTLSYRRDNADNLLRGISEDLIGHITDAVERDAGNDEARLVALEGCIGHLSDDERRLLQQFYAENKSFETIAAGTGKKEPAVRKQVSRLRRTLRLCVEQKMKPAKTPEPSKTN